MKYIIDVGAVVGVILTIVAITVGIIRHETIYAVSGWFVAAYLGLFHVARRCE
jgi:hypothetical protein